MKVDDIISEDGVSDGNASYVSFSGSVDTSSLTASPRKKLRKEVTPSLSVTRKSPRFIPSPLSARKSMRLASSPPSMVRSEQLASSVSSTRKSERLASSQSFTCSSGQVASPSKTRRSERLANPTLSTPNFKKKSGKFEKSSMPSHLERSDRGKRFDSSSSLGSRNYKKLFGSLNESRMKENKVISTKRLKNKNMEGSRSQKQNMKCTRVKGKTMNARTYKALIKMQQRIIAGPDGGDNELEKPVKTLEADWKRGSIDSEQVVVKTGIDSSKRTGERDFPLNKKRNVMGTNSVASEDNSYSVAVNDSSQVPNVFVESCAICAESCRVSFDAPKQKLCSCEMALKNKKNRNINGIDFQESSLNAQLDGQESVCITCKLGGEHLCCNGKGCNRCYHFLCLDPPLDYILPLAWFCRWCVKKKIKLGVHSVSRGIESIWNVREMEFSDAKELRRQKQYLVKYKDLAHIHNHWVPESHLLAEVPLLVSKFNCNIQDTRWNVEWTIPHRLLKKRLIMFPRLEHGSQYESGDNFPDDCYEWLVKWHGLDYEHATWEFQKLPILCSSQGQKLMGDYETRCERAKRVTGLHEKSNKGCLVKNNKGILVKLSELPAKALLGTDTKVLNSVNRFRDFWHRSQHAILFDEEGRMMKVVLFILSLCDVHLPFLIITSPTAIFRWETEFTRLAPSIDVLVYNGSSHSRKCLRMLEFLDRGVLMFQVLLSSAEDFSEDLEILRTFMWEAVIIDECQLPGLGANDKQIKKLMTDFRVLLFNGQLKDSVADYLNLLSLLHSDNDVHCSGVLTSDFSNGLVKLKEKLSRFVVYDCNSNFSRFVEFWVPVQMSNLQLEQYCFTLLSNSISLRTSAKSDHVGALRDILISVRKCCDHPYIADPTLQRLITKDFLPVDYLDVGVKACGKLQLLDGMLLEIKNRQLKVVILFKSTTGSESTSIGDLLDDFVCQRFGPDSYERVDVGVSPSKKQTALNKFNVGSGVFVFLLESRACLSSIKLSSVDIVIIFGSDWNPANDLKALRRISIDSQVRQIPVFRFYTSFTIEENLLDLSKRVPTLSSNLLNISRSFIDSLLMQSASCLFSRLDEFHDKCLDSCVNYSSDQSVLNEVVNEVQNILFCSNKNNGLVHSMISKAHHLGGLYSTDHSLINEQKISSIEGQSPHVFWSNLFRERTPQWKYFSGVCHKKRKRVQYEPPKNSELENDVEKTQKEVANRYVDIASLQHGRDDGNSPRTEKESEISADMVRFEEGTQLGAQEALHDRLKPEISKLCDIMELQEDIKVMAGRFLEYVIKNRRVNEEPAAIFQAFKISLCWTGASLLKHKLDKKKSFALAKYSLNFSCMEEEATCIYMKLQLLKKQFLYELKNFSSKMPETAISEQVANTECAGITTPVASSQVKHTGDAITCDLVNASSRHKDEAKTPNKDNLTSEELSIPLVIHTVPEDYNCSRSEARLPEDEHSQLLKTSPKGQTEPQSSQTIDSELVVLSEIEGETSESPELSSSSLPRDFPLIQGQSPAGKAANVPSGKIYSSSENCSSTLPVEDKDGSLHPVICQAASELCLRLSADTIELPVGQNGPGLETDRVINQLDGDQVSFFPNDVSSNLVVENATVNSNQPILQTVVTGTNLEPHSLNDTAYHPEIRSVGEPILRSVLTSRSSGVASSQPFENAEFLNEAILQYGAILSTSQGSINLPFLTTNQAFPQTRIPSAFVDPLQNELERIHKETEQTMKFHENLKIQLKSECDKEIEARIAEIRSKFDAKCKDAEEALMLKKKKMDTNHNKVLMNKMLAEAFKCKSQGLSPIEGVGTREAAGTLNRFMAGRSHISSPSLARASANPLSCASQPADDQTNRTGSLMADHHPSSSTLTRAPHVVSVTPSIETVRANLDLRAPAPHLQRSAPSMSTSASYFPSTPWGMSSQLAYCHLPVRPFPPPMSWQPAHYGLPSTSLPLPIISCPLPSARPRQTLLAAQTPVGGSIQIPASPNRLTSLLLSHSNALSTSSDLLPNFLPQPNLEAAQCCVTTNLPLGAAGWDLFPLNLSQFATELLLDMENLQTVSPQPSGNANVGTDVICLSDED